MRNILFYIGTGYCAVFFFAASAYSQEKSNQTLTQTQTDSCQIWFSWTGLGGPQTQVVYKQQRDTLMHYIESCAKNDESYDAFSSITSAVQGYMPNDTDRYERYRDWLLSVVYLNTTQPEYFCACVLQMASTYGYDKYSLPNAGLAVIEFLMKNKTCDSPGLEYVDSSSKASRHLSWLEGDTTKPEDRWIPSLDSIGLGILLQHANASGNTTIPSIYLASFTSSPNPFVKETILEFTLNRMAYIQLSIYDELGRLVWGDGRGSSLEAGAHTMHIDGNSIPSGTLYARISTGFGEVKTVKLVHGK